MLVVSIEDVATAQQTQRDFPHLTVVSDEQRELSDAAELINRGFAPDGGNCATPTILLVDNSGTCAGCIAPRVHRATVGCGAGRRTRKASSAIVRAISAR